MSGSGSRVLASVVWATAWVLALTSVGVAWAYRLPAEPPPVFLSPAPPEIRDSAWTIDVVVALVYGPVAALILWRRPHPVGVLLAILSVGSGLAAFGLRYGQLGDEVRGLPVQDLVAFTGGWAFVPGTFVLAILPLLVRHDRLPSSHRVMVAVSLGAGVVATFVSMTQQRDPEPVNPLAIDHAGYQDLLVPVYTAASALALALAVISCVVVVRRALGSEARTGLSWLALGHVVLTASYIAMATPAALSPPSWVIAVALIAPTLGQAVYPAAVLVVVLGQRLWGVEVVVNRVILWALLSACAIAVYLVVVAVVSAVMPGERELVRYAVPALIAMTARPCARWLQRRVDALVYGEGADPAGVLATMESRWSDGPTGVAGLQELCLGLRRSLRLGGVVMRRRDGTVVAAAGRLGRGALEITVAHGGRELGEVVMSPRPGERLDRRTVRSVDAVLGFLAIAWRRAETTVELERVRNALMSARVEERRQVRRDLHDDLGPSLTGAGFGLAAVENRWPDDVDEAVGLLHELTRDVRRDADRAATLLERVEPTGDRDVELRTAVEAVARRLSTPACPVDADVVLDPDRPVRGPVAEVARLVAAEAVTNALRHGRPTRVRVWARVDGPTLRLRVADDGVGLAPDVVPGVGTSSMRERAASMGGHVEILGSPSGTTVDLELPVPVRQDRRDRRNEEPVP